jgi:hypothetical protein
MTPMQRSLAMLRANGWHCEIVERWNSHAKVKQDLWGFVDILAIRRGRLMAVQTTTGANMAARVKKIQASPLLELVSEVACVEVHGWRKLKSGWHCRVDGVIPRLEE